MIATCTLVMVAPPVGDGVLGAGALGDDVDGAGGLGAGVLEEVADC